MDKIVEFLLKTFIEKFSLAWSGALSKPVPSGCEIQELPYHAAYQYSVTATRATV